MNAREDDGDRRGDWGRGSDSQGTSQGSISSPQEQPASFSTSLTPGAEVPEVKMKPLCEELFGLCGLLQCEVSCIFSL